MPARRKMDYYLLRQLVEQHPDWSMHQFASTISADNQRRYAAWLKEHHPNWDERQILNAVKAKAEDLVVTPAAVSSAIRNWQDRWIAQGADISERSPTRYSNLIPWEVPVKYRGHWILQKMRLVGRMRSGLTLSERDLKTAQNFERELVSMKQVVDLTRSGRPVVRPAEPWELDDEGNLARDKDGHPNITASEEPESERATAGARS